LAGFGGAIGLLARPSGQLLGAHGHPGAIGADIQDGRVAPAGFWAWRSCQACASWPTRCTTRWICRADTWMAPVSAR
jgi:hypothetical protein